MPEKFTFGAVLERELEECKTLLDLGCGPRSSVKSVKNAIRFSVGVDLFWPYIRESRESSVHHYYVMADLMSVAFQPKVFDCVVALDVLEHLEKGAGEVLLERMQAWATRRVIILTPNGFIPQSKYDDNLLQTHRSGWTVGEFRNRGFEVYGINGLRWLRRERKQILSKPYWLWERASNVAQRLAFSVPELAFHLLCVKRMP